MGKNIKALYKNPKNMSMSISLLPLVANSNLHLTIGNVCSQCHTSRLPDHVDALVFLNANGDLLH